MRAESQDSSDALYKEREKLLAEHREERVEWKRKDTLGKTIGKVNHIKKRNPIKR